MSQPFSADPCELSADLLPEVLHGAQPLLFFLKNWALKQCFAFYVVFFISNIIFHVKVCVFVPILTSFLLYIKMD